MTYREFLETIKNVNVNDEITAYAEAEIAKLDARNEKRRNTPTKTQVENAPLMDKIVDEILDESPKTASEIADILGVSVQKTSALLRSLVAAGKAASGEAKVPKKGVVKTYTVA